MLCQKTASFVLTCNSCLIRTDLNMFPYSGLASKTFFKAISQHGTCNVWTGFHSFVNTTHKILSHFLQQTNTSLWPCSPTLLSHPCQKYVACFYGTQAKSDNCKVRSDKMIINRNIILSHHLGFTPEEMSEVISRNTFLKHLSFQLIKDKVELMKVYNLPMSFIKKNLRILYNISVGELYRRLELLKNNGFLSQNPVLEMDKLGYYLECQNETFKTGFQRLCSELKALEGCSSQAEYIEKRFKCTKQQAVFITLSYPLNRSVSNVKLKEFLDFALIEANLNPVYVMHNMRLISFSTSRLRFRYKIINDAKVPLENWAEVWNLSEKKFNERFRNYIL